MSEIILYEPFDDPEPDGRLKWYCQPTHWSIQDSCLVVETDPRTDYWQRTHYGFSNDNGHFLYAEVGGNFILSTKVRFYPAHQYDQAGLMVRVTPDCWLKTSVEYELEGPSKLGAVVTNRGYSDWSTQNFLQGVNELEIRLRRDGSDYTVEYLEGQAWVQLRLAHLHHDPQTAILCGLYACSPIDAGYRAEFDFLKIEEG